MIKLALGSKPARPKASLPIREVHVGELIIGNRERHYLQQVIESSRLSYGPFTRRFERMFAELHGVPHACFCNSGTSALQLALTALKEQRGWQAGDEVIVPAVTFVATINMVLLTGLKPVLVDVRPDTYTIDPELIAKAITPKTRCIIPVHLLGLPADMDPIKELASRHHLAVIEDSCETMFARYRGQPVGSMGDVGCFSTYVAHFIVTGVGGLTTTKDPELAVLIRSLMNHGRDSIYLNIDDDDDRTTPQFEKIVDRRFRFERVGFSYRCTELEAAIGLAQLEQHAGIIEARRRNAEYLTSKLSTFGDFLQLPTIPADREYMFMVYGLSTRSREMHDLIHFLEQHGIETRDMLPLIHQPVYREMFGADVCRQFPVAHHLWNRGFYIGCHQHLTREDLDHILAVFAEFFSN